MVRCGLIGCGNVAADMHLPVLAALQVQVSAVCDVVEERARAFATRHKIPRWSNSVSQFLSENADLDFVVLTTPGFTHYEIATQVLSARLPLFVEKPLALSYADALRLSELACANNVPVCVGQTWRFRDEVIQARLAVERGQVGQVYQTNMVHHAASLFHASVPSWLWQERKHKVLIFEHAMHFLDMQVHLTGPVKKLLHVKVNVDPNLDATYRIYALVEHVSGATGILDLQQFASSYYTQLELFGTANDILIKFFPSAYRLYSGRVSPIDELRDDVVRIKDYAAPILSGRLRKPLVPRQAVPHLHLYREFLRAVQGKAPSPVSIEDVLPTMEYADQLSRAVYG